MGEEAEVTLFLYSYTEPLASVTATTASKEAEAVTQKLWPPQCPCFLRICSLKSSSDLDLPQHSVDLPAHHASLGSLALWTHGLDSVH